MRGGVGSQLRKGDGSPSCRTCRAARPRVAVAPFGATRVACRTTAVERVAERLVRSAHRGAMSDIGARYRYACPGRRRVAERATYDGWVRTKHVQTLVRVFATTTPSALGWGEVEAMLRAYGATLAEGRGSRIRVESRGVRAVFRRPHPSKELDRGAFASLRRFLEHAGVTP